MKFAAAAIVIVSLFTVVRGEWDSGDGLFDGFDGNELSSEWKKARKNWGGQIDGDLSYNGGVMPENVSVNDGKLRLEAHGNQYSGDLMGINKNLCARDNGYRVGAAVATERYFASGRYEVRARIAPEFGVASAFWTFHYQEFYPADEEYVLKPVGGDSYYAINHEIDVEFPGRPGPAYTDISFDRALMNSWVGENDDEQITSPVEMVASQDDGEFHTYRFDWHTGSETEEQRVDFFVDGTLVRKITKYVPTLASRFWLGAWFPRNWAGTPDFDVTEMQVDWVRITPFKESGDDWSTAESFADFGWEDSIQTCVESGPAGSLPPVETFANENLDVNVFGGVNDVVYDSQEDCGSDPETASQGSILRRFNGIDGSYLRFRFTVIENAFCGYEYSAFSQSIGPAYRDMSGATGVRFYIRGNRAESVKLSIKANTASGCLGGNKKNEMSIIVPVATEWSLQDVAFTAMSDYREACPFMPADMTDVGSLVFELSEVGNGRIDLDSIEFY